MTSLRVTAPRADIGAGLIIALFAAWAFYVTLGFDPPALKGFPGAAFFPRLILAVLFPLGAALCVRGLIRSFKTAREPAPADSEGQPATGRVYEFDLVPFLLSLGGVLAMLALMQAAGLEIAVALYLGILLWVGSRRLVWSVVMALVGTAVIYLVFVHILGVHMPLLFLPRYF